MGKRSSYAIKKNILQLVKEQPATYAELERKVNTGFRTIKANCEELAQFNQVHIQEIIHPANGKLAHVVKITAQGTQALAKNTS